MKTSGLISQPEVMFSTVQSKLLLGDSLHRTSNAHSITQPNLFLGAHFQTAAIQETLLSKLST